MTEAAREPAYPLASGRGFPPTLTAVLLTK
jgi:hypothetical protein